tara:strand:- start:12 stop:317 length:306 start_codon:yes stop_codon:yes gene_type:complete
MIFEKDVGTDDDGRPIYKRVEVDDIRRDNAEDYTLVGDKAWITVHNISVHIARKDDGVSVSLYPLNHEDGDSITETWATYGEAMVEQQKPFSYDEYPCGII